MESSQSFMAQILKQNVWLFLSLIAYLLMGYFLFGSAGDDDSYITYSAAYLFGKEGSLLNINGSHVEQSSSLLLVLILGGLYKITSMPLPILGLTFSVAMGMATIIACQKIINRNANQSAKHLAPLLLILTAYTYWCYSGMEVALTSFIVVILIISLCEIAVNAKRIIWVQFAIFSCFYLLARPESIFVLLLSITLFLVITQINQANDIAAKNLIKAIFLVMSIGFIIVIARYMYFDKAFPLPVYAKTSGVSPQKALVGAYYVASNAPIVILLAMLTIIPYAFLSGTGNKIAGNKTKIFLAISSSFVIAHLLFVISVGGDYMRGGRFIHPITPLVVIAIFLIADSFQYLKYAVFVLLGISAVEVNNFAHNDAMSMHFSKRSSVMSNLRNDVKSEISRWSRVEYQNGLHMQSIPLILKLEELIPAILMKNGKVTIMSGQMGIVPLYLLPDYYKKIEFYDRWGLVTEHVTDCPLYQGKEYEHFLGVGMDYTDFFKNYPDGSCGMEKPMIIYDLSWGENNQNAVSDNGYTIVYLSANKYCLDDCPGYFEQFIAVRNDLM